MFPDTLRSLRIENKLTQKELAEKLNMQNTAISKYELGEREPDIENLNKLAEFFQCSIDYLLGKSKIKNAHANINADSDIEELLENLHKRPELKMLFSVTKNASKEDIEKAVKIIETLKGE